MTSVIPGHPRVAKAAVFDIITPDLVVGPTAATGEALSIVNDCLNNFANVGQHFEIHISHSQSEHMCLIHVALADIIPSTRCCSGPCSQRRAQRSHGHIGSDEVFSVSKALDASAQGNIEKCC